MQCGKPISLKEYRVVTINSIVHNIIYHNIPYTTFRKKHRQYKRASDKENWSPTSKRRYNNRVFTDSTEKQAAEFDKKYVETNKPRDANDFAASLMMIHNQKNPASVVIMYHTVHWHVSNNNTI